MSNKFKWKCSDGSAVWTGNYSSLSRAAERAAHWCAGGGNCYPEQY